jgi:hypothetical protein
VGAAPSRRPLVFLWQCGFAGLYINIFRQPKVVGGAGCALIDAAA